MREKLDHEVSPRGQGNVVSIEFNLLYRWHAAVSEHDTKWTEDLFASKLRGFDMKTVGCLLGSSCRLMSYGLTDLRGRFRGERTASHESWSGCPAVGVWRVRDVVQIHQRGYTYTQLHSIKRDDFGRFKNADLARILLDATEASASAFKARGTPEVLRVVELLSIEQARAWGACTVSMFQACCTGFLSYCSS
jgi:linoleate 10R-lipoxygenase